MILLDKDPHPLFITLRQKGMLVNEPHDQAFGKTRKKTMKTASEIIHERKQKLCTQMRKIEIKGIESIRLCAKKRVKDEI